MHEHTPHMVSLAVGFNQYWFWKADIYQWYFEIEADDIQSPPEKLDYQRSRKLFS